MARALRNLTLFLSLLAGGCWVDGDPGATARPETPTGVYATPEAAGIDDPAAAAREEAANHETAGDRFDEAVDHASEAPATAQQPATE